MPWKWSPSRPGADAECHKGCGHAGVPRSLVVGILMLTLVVALPTLPAADGPREIRGRIDAAAKLAASGKPDEAVTALVEAAAGLEALAAAPQPSTAVRPLVDRAAAVRRRLERDGVDVSAIVLPETKQPAAAPRGRPNQPAAAAISFAKDVAPILASRCGGCHVSGKKGNFQMVSYEGLMKTGMVQRGQGEASRLVEVILSGDMPRGGGKVSPAEVGTLMKWIDGGAPCDVDPSLALDAVVRGASPPPVPVAVAAPKPVKLAEGEVSFASQVVPVLLDACVNCHGEGETEANFDMRTLESLVKGGRTGGAITAGEGAGSLLVKKLRGKDIDGQRMPLGKEPLPDDVIAMIERWIDEGARIDLLTAKDPLDALAAAGRAARLSDGELAGIRETAARKVWRQAIPDEEPLVERRDGVCVVGNLSAPRMAELAAAAEALWSRIGTDLAGDDGPFLKGGVVLFAFRQGYDYSAFWQNVVGRERPRGAQGHAGVAGDAVYGAVLVPSDADAVDDLRLTMAEQMATAALLGRGLPEWFASGAGRVAAQRAAPKAPLVATWKKELPAAVRGVGAAADFFKGAADPAARTAAAGGFVAAISGGGGKLRQFLRLLAEDGDFDTSFTKAFRGAPQQLYEAWAAKEGRKP